MSTDKRADPQSIYEILSEPFRVFAHHHLAGSTILLAAAVAALVWANSPWGDVYRELLRVPISIGMGDLILSKPLLHWINDALMGVFFFVVGLEIKQEFLVGHLSTFRKAWLPISAALGGMIIPAAIFLAFNAGEPTMNGWAIPMATDIAFCLGIMALLGHRLPSNLKFFLVTLAIVDDIGSIVVIAFFYTDSLSWISLGLGGLLLCVSVGCNRLGIRNSAFYFLLGTLAWLAFLKSGVHATLAAVLMAFTIPARTRIDATAFIDLCDRLIGEFRQSSPEEHAHFLNDEQQRAIDGVDLAMAKISAPSQRLSHALGPATTFFVLPVFALANAGLIVAPEQFASLSQPLALGIMLGLVVGKPVGIFGCTWVMVRLGVTELPEGVSLRHIYGVSVLAGIGFTMSLFIGSLAFVEPQQQDLIKLSVILASVVSAAIGWIVLRFWAPAAPRHETTEAG